MRIQHGTPTGRQGKRTLESNRRRENRRLAQLLLSALLFLGVFSCQNLFPEQSQPVLEQLQAALRADTDWGQVSRQVSAAIQGEESVGEVFRAILDLPQQETEAAETAETQEVGLFPRPAWLD